MKNPLNLKNHFLIAMPSLHDSIFARTLIYVCEHNAEGAMGLVLNRPLGFSFAELLGQINIESHNERLAELPVHFGGPVQPERGAVLHSGERDFNSTLEITPDISMTTSRDILEAIAEGDEPNQFLVALGYAGWEAGQLEREVSENSWLTRVSEPSLLFGKGSDSRWHAAAMTLGVDMNLISMEAGRA